MPTDSANTVYLGGEQKTAAGRYRAANERGPDKGAAGGNTRKAAVCQAVWHRFGLDIGLVEEKEMEADRERAPADSSYLN